MTLKLGIVGVPLALILASRARRKGSLDPTGAACAFVVGAVAFTASLRFGAALLVFFYSSSRLTRVGAKRKAEIEGIEYAGEGGNRTWVQVVCNGLWATLAALILVWLRVGGGVPNPSAAEAAIVLSAGHPGLVISLLQVAYVSHYACCNADTWASELGAPRKPPTWGKGKGRASSMIRR